MLTIFAHGGEVHELQTTETSLIPALTHQPTWLSLLIVIFFLFGVYALLEKLKVKPLNRLLALLPLTLLIAIIYLSHNPAVTTVLMIAGFIATFYLAFTQMRTPNKKDKIPEEPNNKPPA